MVIRDLGCMVWLVSLVAGRPGGRRRHGAGPGDDGSPGFVSLSSALTTPRGRRGQDLLRPVRAAVAGDIRERSRAVTRCGAGCPGAGTRRGGRRRRGPRREPRRRAGGEGRGAVRVAGGNGGPAGPEEAVRAPAAGTRRRGGRAGGPPRARPSPAVALRGCRPVGMRRDGMARGVRAAMALRAGRGLLGRARASAPDRPRRSPRAGSAAAPGAAAPAADREDPPFAGLADRAARGGRRGGHPAGRPDRDPRSATARRRRRARCRAAPRRRRCGPAPRPGRTGRPCPCGGRPRPCPPRPARPRRRWRRAWCPQPPRRPRLPPTMRRRRRGRRRAAPDAAAPARPPGTAAERAPAGPPDAAPEVLLEGAAGRAVAQVRAHAPAAQRAAVAVRQRRAGRPHTHRRDPPAHSCRPARASKIVCLTARAELPSTPRDLLVARARSARAARAPCAGARGGRARSARSSARPPLATAPPASRSDPSRSADRTASTASRRRRSIEIDSLWAIRNSHGRSSKSRSSPLQRREAPWHRALQRILRVLVVVQDRAAVAIQRLVMAQVERRERRRVPARRPRAQRRLPAQRGQAASVARALGGHGRHHPRIGNARDLPKSGPTRLERRRPDRQRGGVCSVARTMRHAVCTGSRKFGGSS